jgi:glycosyltransferase involved in cell wall biosynthesis
VGTITKNIVDSLNDASEDLDIKVSVAYINVDKDSEVFNKKCFDAASKLVKKYGGHMIPLCNSSKGQSEWDMWRSFDEWKYSCVSLVTALNLILENDEQNYIILNDTPFLFFAKYKELVDDEDLKCFYFPLSTGKNHAFGDKDWRDNRVRAEQECFDLIEKDSNSKVIVLGDNFAEHMSKEYGLSFSEDDYLQNGLYLDRYSDFLEEKFTNRDLKEFGIKLKEDKKIIFSWGRCSVAKGFKELALAWSEAYEYLPNYYLILQMPNNSGEPDYFAEVKEILSDTSRYMVIDDFNPQIWKTVLRNKNTDVVCIPSIMDPFPHTAIEAKLFSKSMNFLTIISDVDGAVDAFNKKEALRVDPRDTKEFSKKLIKAATMKEEEKRSIIYKNQETIEMFDFPKIFKEFIKKNMELQ